METPLKTKIFYDGNCIVCDTEISHYSRMAPDLFALVDIANPSFDAKAHGLTPEAVQKHMHVLTPEGTILKGVDAFTHIWSRLPAYKLASRVLRLPGIYASAKLGYELFARNRHLLPKKIKK